VQAVEANRQMGIEAILYAIEDTRSGDRLFHGTDTGPLQERTWPRLAGLGWDFDLVVLDQTFGLGRRSGGHLNQKQFLEEVAATRAAGLLKESTRIIATHLAHHSHPTPTEMARLVGGHGYEIAYDGWVADTRGATHDRVDGADS
jgi:hypothetical protein